MTGVTAAGGIKKRLFDAAVRTKARGLQHGHLKHAVYDRLIFDKIKRGLGMDHLRVMISGSAPLSDDVMTFFRCLLGVVVLEGYGQTEGAAAATLSHPDDIATVGHVGGPTGCVEIVLVNVPEMGYLHTDRQHRGQPCYGRGEICIRGPNVFKGYYKDEKTTRETIDEEGWLHSGDIGLWRSDGSLQIIDRKKNIFKLSQGEYVAPEKIENILMQSALVAVVVPDEEPVKNWAATVEGGSLSTAPIEQICQSDRFNKAILKDIARLSKENGLHGFETVRAIHVEAKPFSVENDLMTPTFKLKRQKIRDKYEKLIGALYANLASRSRL
jgi:long-chain acyl-CoA synthetase